MLALPWVSSVLAYPAELGTKELDTTEQLGTQGEDYRERGKTQRGYFGISECELGSYPLSELGVQREDVSFA